MHTHSHPLSDSLTPATVSDGRRSRFLQHSSHPQSRAFEYPLGGALLIGVVCVFKRACVYAFVYVCVYVCVTTIVCTGTWALLNLAGTQITAVDICDAGAT